jgi:hypothetical protein
MLWQTIVVMVVGMSAWDFTLGHRIILTIHVHIIQGHITQTLIMNIPIIHLW